MKPFDLIFSVFFCVYVHFYIFFSPSTNVHIHTFLDATQCVSTRELILVFRCGCYRKPAYEQTNEHISHSIFTVSHKINDGFCIAYSLYVLRNKHH